MTCWHVIEGEAGCRYAVDHGCAAIIVDALRASATAAMLLDAGATELHVVRSVEEAHAAKAAMPDALLFGERGGLPPEGFDYGNSPQTVAAAKGRRVIFTTTTGAGRLVQAWGAAQIFMGTTTNAHAVIDAAFTTDRDVVIVPAGLMGEPGFNAQEDWVASAYLAGLAEKRGAIISEGRDLYQQWHAPIEHEGLDALFASAPHADKLRALSLDSDIAWCARTDQTSCVPMGVARTDFGVLVNDYAVRRPGGPARP